MTLSVASLGGFKQEVLALVQVLGHAEAFQHVDAEPVGADDVALEGGEGVVAGGLFFVLLAVGDFGEGASRAG